MPTWVNTNQHESNTNQHESDTSQHESISQEISIDISVYLVKYENSLSGLNVTFSHYLELGSKENQRQTGEISGPSQSFRK